MEREKKLVGREEYIYGTRAVMEAVKAGRSIDKVLIKNGLSNELAAELLRVLREYGVPFQYVPVEKINRITRKNHQGVVALAAPVDFISLAELLPALYEKGEDPFLLVLDQVTDVRNFGAIVRTAVCAGVHGVVFPEKGSARIGEDAMKTSAGALGNIALCRAAGMAGTLRFLRDSGLRLIAATEKGSSRYYDADLKGPVALILGSEEKGISPALLALADGQVRIPLAGNIASLNVAAAAAVLMFETARQRTGGQG